MFSIIVPVYNTEKYIRKTIESVINQSFTEWELILIDDGSTDRSLEICQEYGKRDFRIRIISQKNQGVSSARNVGIDMATGNYIMFLDSDDEYKANALESISHVLKKNEVDLIVSSLEAFYVNESVNINKKDYILPEHFENVEDFYLHMRLARVAPGPCRYVIKKQIVLENSLYFPIGITMGEDCLWLCKMLKHIDSVIYNPNDFYKYNIHENSITTTIDVFKLKNLMEVCEEIYKMAETTTGELTKLYYSYCNILGCSLLQNYFTEEEKMRHMIKSWFMCNKSLFEKSLKVRKPLAFSSAIIGSFYSLLIHSRLVLFKKWMLKVYRKH